MRHPPVQVLAAAALLLPACTDKGADQASRLDRIEHRLAVLEKRAAQAERLPAPQAGTAKPGAETEPPGPDASALSSGALAVLHPAPQRAEQLGDIPADAVGGFVYSGGAIALDDASKRGARYAGPTGLELQGWLRANQAGRYQFGADVRTRLGLNQFLSPDCILQAAIEDRQIGAQRVQPAHDATSGDLIASPVVGADLQPGLYKLRLWVACTRSVGQKTNVTLLVKSPSEINLRGLTGADVLHKTR